MQHWEQLKTNINAIQLLQEDDGLIKTAKHDKAKILNKAIQDNIQNLIPQYLHDEEYLQTVIKDLQKWENEGFKQPDFLASVKKFNPAHNRINGLKHLVIFPMNTQNGKLSKTFEAVKVEKMWPYFIQEVENLYPNKLFLSLKLEDYTEGYNTHSAVLFPETVSMKETPEFTWGAIFQNREAARFRKVITEAISITGLQIPDNATKLLEDQKTTENTFILWDLIHDRTHMSGDLPFDPFMIRQRMPYFLYGLEELRCDLTAFRECMKLTKNETMSEETRYYAQLVQYAVIFDRIFRFACTGKRHRNYDAFAGQLLFAWLHKNNTLNWTDNKLSINWDLMPETVTQLGNEIDKLYWASIDRPKIAHWLTAYNFVTNILEPHPASLWSKGKDHLPLTGTPKEIADTFMDDEFPLSMFYEALQKKLEPVIENTVGIRTV